MANTSGRTLRLLSLLQSHRFWPGPELAERLDVSPRTLRRDVDRLRELGYPVEARRGTDGGYQLAPGATMPPLVLGDEEAVALVVGLHAATQSPVAGVAESSVRVLANVVELLPRPLRRQADALVAATVHATWDGAEADIDREVLTTLAQACRDTVRVGFGYVDRVGARTERYVEPYRLVMLGRRWYLLGWDPDRGDWRTFRLDRVTDPVPTRGRFTPRDLPGGDAAAFVRSRLAVAAPTHAIDVIVQLPATAIPARLARWASVEAHGSDACRLRFEAESLDWPVLALGALEADFTVVAPVELVERLGDWGGRFVRAARATGDSSPVPVPLEPSTTRRRR